MKKIIALVLVLSLVFVLASCGKTLSGTYGTGELLGTGATYTFKGSNVTVTAKVLGFEKSFEGKYEIFKDDNGAEKIKFTFENSEAKEYAGTFSFSEGDNSITIGGVTYNKK
ncbi:MAG: hypothetical protein IJW87_01155 [Clostridia bacterium]|nr:hypothetical protein [Clostridia bacterium]